MNKRREWPFKRVFKIFRYASLTVLAGPVLTKSQGESCVCLLSGTENGHAVRVDVLSGARPGREAGEHLLRRVPGTGAAGRRRGVRARAGRRALLLVLRRLQPGSGDVADRHRRRHRPDPGDHRCGGPGLHASDQARGQARDARQPLARSARCRVRTGVPARGVRRVRGPDEREPDAVRSGGRALPSAVDQFRSASDRPRTL